MYVEVICAARQVSFRRCLHASKFIRVLPPPSLSPCHSLPSVVRISFRVRGTHRPCFTRYRVRFFVCLGGWAACSLAEGGAQTAKRTSAMAGLVARFLPVVEAFFVANARDPKGVDLPPQEEQVWVCVCLRVLVLFHHFLLLLTLQYIYIYSLQCIPQ